VADLTSLANTKAWLTLTGTADDDTLTRLISAVSYAIQNLINRQFAGVSYAETRNGNGRPAMFLSNGPVTAVASVTVDGATIPAKPSPTAAGYSFDDNIVYLDGYAFTQGNRNVVINYTAGYLAVPPDIEQAAIDIIAFQFRSRDRIGLASKVLSGETTSFLRDIPPQTMRVLQQYQRTILTR
jgi:hypothetical protein